MGEVSLHANSSSAEVIHYMINSRPALDLVRATLNAPNVGDAEILAWLEAALESEQEPLRFFAGRAGISEAEIYERAAIWAGLAFSQALPKELPSRAPITQPENLATVKSLRADLFGREVLFTACGFTEILRLREQLIATPSLAQRICVVPPAALRAGLTDRASAMLLDEARSRLARRWPYASAHLDLGLFVRLIYVVLLAMLVCIAIITPYYAQQILLPLMAFLLLVPAGLRLAAAAASFATDASFEHTNIEDADLPTYTLLLPLRDEANMVRQLASAMQNLDYPAEKLDIKFVVESKSVPTLHAAANELSDLRFELVIVPDSSPRTKPKALNFALPLARGEFIVIYDAEDIPERDQLRRAAQLFREQPEVDCFQAELAIDNAGENWLTALFAGEYAGLFGLILPAFSRWNMPLPLGGTSNHFRTQSLKEAGGWDAFNVTEDADLGVRLTRLRYKTGTFTSQTFEEAPVSLSAWMNQRTRWMKGWMQTFIVHNSRPWVFLSDIGLRNFLIFQAYVGGMIVSAPLHVAFLSAMAIRAAMGTPLGITPTDLWSTLSFLILVLGYGSAFLVAVLGLVRQGQAHLVAFQILLPFYWVLTSIAAIRALYELIVRPYFWAKTPHGLTGVEREDSLQSSLRRK